MDLFKGSVGRAGAAASLGGIVLFAMWIAWIPLVGDAAIFIAAIFAGATVVGVLRVPQKDGPLDQTPPRRTRPQQRRSPGGSFADRLNRSPGR